MESELEKLIAHVMAGVTTPTEWPNPAPLVNQERPEWLADLQRLRAQHDALAIEATHRCPPLPVPRREVAVESEYVSITVESGCRQGARLYRPRSECIDRPAILLLHGGGWWMAGGAVAFELGDPFCRVLASELDAVVLNFDYRLAPEHRYPTALNDAEAAVRWLAQSASSLGVDTKSLCVFGISSGGNLAAALARRLRDSELALKLQMLHVPARDLTFSSPASMANPAWRQQGELLRSYYLPSDVDAFDPLVSPALAHEFAGLPPAIVIVARFDPLRDDGIRYAQGLSRDGVPCVVLDHEMTHGIATAEVTERWMGELVDHATQFLNN